MDWHFRVGDERPCWVSPIERFCSTGHVLVNDSLRWIALDTFDVKSLLFILLSIFYFGCPWTYTSHSDYKKYPQRFHDSPTKFCKRMIRMFRSFCSKSVDRNNCGARNKNLRWLSQSDFQASCFLLIGACFSTFFWSRHTIQKTARKTLAILQFLQDFEKTLAIGNVKKFHVTH